MMNSQLDSQSNLLKKNTDQITIDQLKNCSVCNKPIKGEIEEYERRYCKTSLKSPSDDNNKQVYYSLILVEEKVNIYHLKSFIIKNQNFLRQIIIQHCQFYLSNEDLENNISVGPLRMLQEIDFNYMFEMFSFQDISTLEIDVCNTDKDLLKGTTYFMDFNSNNSKNSRIKQKTTKVLSVEENNEILPKEEFLNEFNCDQNCKIMEYEYGKEKQEVYEKMIKKRQESEEKIIRKLKFGDCLQKDKFGELLLENYLSEIKYHLETYKMYTKYAFNDGKLLILGDVLNNPFSLIQLQNLIQINLQLINAIIFKDNQSIPHRIFSQLMKYFLQVPSLKMISFISSVLSQDSFNDLQYLIKQKQIDYLVLHKSYFLKEEINQIIRIKEENFVLNDLRYYIFQLQFDQIYEFTPYSFSYDLLKSKQNCDLLDVEVVYLDQQKYPKKIKSMISFFQGKNLSILHDNQSSKLILQIKDIKKLCLAEKRDLSKELEKLLEQLIQTDDINFIVLQTFKLGMSYYDRTPFKNDSIQKQLYNQLLKKKSYQSTIQIFSNLKIQIENFGLWQLFALSFLSGFSKSKQKDIQSFIFKSTQISNIIGLKSLKSNNIFDIKHQKNKDYFSDYFDILIKFELTFEKSVLENCKNLSQLEIIRENFENKINDISFENIYFEIEQLHFKQIQPQLCRDILYKCTRLKKIIFQDFLFNFEYFNEGDKSFETIEELLFQKCLFSNQLFLNNFLKSTTQLKDLQFQDCKFNYQLCLNTLLQSTNQIKVLNFNHLCQCQFEDLNIKNIQTSIEVLNIPIYLTPQYFQYWNIHLLKNLKNLNQLFLYHIIDKDEQNLDNQLLHENTYSLKKIVLRCLNTRMLLFLNYLLKSSPNLSIIELKKCLKQDCKIDFEQLQLLDLSKIKELSINFTRLKDLSFDFQDLNILQLFKDLKKLILHGISFSKEININKISKKLTKIHLDSCKLTTQFIQLILEECQELQNLRLIKNEVLQNENEKLDFTKMCIQNLKKLQFYFSEEFFNFDFISNLLEKQNKIKQIIINIDGFKLDANKLINLIRDKKNLEELIIKNDQDSVDLGFLIEKIGDQDSVDLGYLIEKIGDFFDITNFNLRNSWNENIVKNKEINFFNVLDSQNISIYSQLRKQYELIEDKDAFSKNEQKVNVMNGNQHLNKYCNYPPINFYDTFNGINKLKNESQLNQEELNKMLNQQPIYINPFVNQIHNQQLQVLEFFGQGYLTCQNLINCLQNKQQPIDLILIDQQIHGDTQKIIFNDLLLRNLILRKLIIQNCQNISHLLVNVLIHNQQLESLKLESKHLKNLDYNLSSPKLKILDIHYGYDETLSNIENIFDKCNQLQLLKFDYYKNDINFENIPCNLKYFLTGFHLNAEQTNQIINRCKQLEVLEINFKNDSDYNNINFDNLSLHLKKLSFKNRQFSDVFSHNYSIQKKMTNPIIDYLFFQKTYKTNYEQKDELNFLLNNFEQSKNDIYIVITPQLIKSPKFIRYIEQKNIINLTLIDFEDDLNNFFKTFEKQLQNLKHLTLLDCDFNQILYENNNICEYKSIETINIILKEKIFSQVKERNLNFNIFKNIKELTLILEKDSGFQLFQVLQNCTSLESIKFFIDYDTKLDFQDIPLPKSIKIIKLFYTTITYNLIVSSKQLKQCDNLKYLYLDHVSQENKDLQNFPKSLEKLKINYITSLDVFQSIQNFISSFPQNLKKLSCETYSQYIKGIFELIGKINQIKCSYSVQISHVFESEFDNYLTFSQMIAYLQGIFQNIIFFINKFSFILSVYLKKIAFFQFSPNQVTHLNYYKFIQITFHKKLIFNLSKIIQCEFYFTHQFQQYKKIDILILIILNIDLKQKNMDSNYAFEINLFRIIFESNRNASLSTQYLYLSLFSDFIVSQQINLTFLIYSPYTIFYKNKNLHLQKQNVYKEDSFSMIDQFNLLKDHKQYIFGFDRDYFNQATNFYNFYENILSQGSSQLEYLNYLSQKLESLNYHNAYIPYECSIDQQTLNKQKINEYDFLLIISVIPPQKLEIKEMSISFIKSWYAINYYAPLTTETVIHDYNESLIENSSISNLILVYAYQSILNLNIKQSHNFFAKIINKIKLQVMTLLYTIFNSLNSEPKMFKFDHSVIHLEAQFTHIFKAKYHYLIRFLYIFYLFVCAFGVWYFSFDSTQSCGVSLSKYSYIMYFSFGLITFIVEAIFFKMCLNFVSHLIPQMKPDCSVGFPKAQINQIKKFIIDIPWFNQQYVNYSITFVLSQLSRFDFFTNIGFILTTYSCENYILFYCSLASIGSITLINFFIFFIQKNIFGNKEKNKLMTGHIDIFYQICNLLSFLSVADILDIISPSNCLIIKGKMYNQKIIGHFFKIIIQDIPFIVLQALQLISESQINQSVILSIVLSIIMFNVSLIKFISLTPTTIGQKEFDLLNVIKKEKIMPAYQDLLSDFESEICRYNFFEQLKCLKSKNYLKKSLKKNINNQSQEEEEKKQMRIQETLRQSYTNQKSIEQVFGNKEFD